MHFEILVEDVSGKVALEHLLPNVLNGRATFSIHPYKGIGHIPKGLKTTLDASTRVLLNQLPRLLAGYGRAFSKYPADYKAAVIVVCDLDSRDLGGFLGELQAVLDSCNPKPEGLFCIAIEEGESWLLGHKEAVLTAYPASNKTLLEAYQYDSICGTWEVLADIVYPGGSAALQSKGKQEVGRVKSIWANEIAPLIDVSENLSPSFCHFVKSIRSRIGA
ncbi:MAG: hypothetical protein ACK4HF_07625 [Paracoccaceae bacterium]